MQIKRQTFFVLSHVFDARKWNYWNIKFIRRKFYTRIFTKLVKDADSVSLKNNSKFTTTSLWSINVSKCYISKFKKEWLLNPTYSSFLKECRIDQTKPLCFICHVKFSTQKSGTAIILVVGRNGWASEPAFRMCRRKCPG